MKIKLNPDRTKIKSIKVSPDIIPADGHDICNYVFRYGMANFQIQAVLRLDGRLDFVKLLKAVRLSIDAEPVLGCRFVCSDPPYWKRLDDIDNVRFCTMVETNDTDTAVKRFLESPLDMDNGPVLKLKLVRSDSFDTICIKINHACSDGAGVKEYVTLLSDIYCRLYSDVNYVPTPSIRTKSDHRKLFKAVGIKYPTATVVVPQKSPTPLWKFPWKNIRQTESRYAICKLSDGELDKLKNYSKSKGATINDLILTAYYRAMFKISKPPYGIPMDIPLTVSLRRYLPEQKAEAIRNLSGGFMTALKRKHHESFEGTLSRVMSRTRNIKTGHPGIENAIWAEYVEKMDFRQFCNHYKTLSKINDMNSLNPFYKLYGCSPALSNLGLLSATPIKFGDTAVIDAHILPPTVRAPGFLLLAGSYNGVLTLTLAYYKSTVHRVDMQRVIEKIKEELVKVIED
ncbi:MAG: condensation domain-containing protein [Bacillota bacterium]|nr:condensation domain-containing protein [Bacillota bacterium]